MAAPKKKKLPPKKFPPTWEERGRSVDEGSTRYYARIENRAEELSLDFEDYETYAVLGAEIDRLEAQAQLTASQALTLDAAQTLANDIKTLAKHGKTSRPVSQAEAEQVTGLTIQLEKQDPEDPHAIERRTIVAHTETGQIVMEAGGSGTWLRFECPCTEALPYCKAHCCSIYGIEITKEEHDRLVPVGKSKFPSLPIVHAPLTEDGAYGMTRGSDGWCNCLNRATRLCQIYEDRPAVCRDFHCTLGPGMRGWLLDLHRHMGED